MMPPVLIQNSSTPGARQHMLFADVNLMNNTKKFAAHKMLRYIHISVNVIVIARVVLVAS